MITIDSKTLTKFAKAIPSDLRHTQKLDAFANILGYPDQTSLMADMKRKEALAAPAAEAPAAEPAALGVPPQYTLDRKIRDIFSSYLRDPAHDGIFNVLDWSQDVNAGDTTLGYAAWWEEQVENVLENVGIYHVLCGYLRWEIVNGKVALNAGSRNGIALEGAADNVHSFWNIAGGTDAIGEDVMLILETIIEDVMDGSENSEEARRDVIETLMDSVHQRWAELQNDRESPSPE